MSAIVQGTEVSLHQIHQTRYMIAFVIRPMVTLQFSTYVHGPNARSIFVTINASIRKEILASLQ